MAKRPTQSLQYPLTAHQVEVLNSMLETLFSQFRRGNDINTPVGILSVDKGGTGRASAIPWAVILGGITTTGQQQSVSDLGTTGQVLTSNGAGTSPSWQDNAALAIEWSVLTNGDPVNPELIFADGDVIMIRVP